VAPGWLRSTSARCSLPLGAIGGCGRDGAWKTVPWEGSAATTRAGWKPIAGAISPVRSQPMPVAMGCSQQASVNAARLQAGYPRAGSQCGQFQAVDAPDAASPGVTVRKKRRLSAAGRRAMIEATKRRWEAFSKGEARSGPCGGGHFTGCP